MSADDDDDVTADRQHPEGRCGLPETQPALRMDAAQVRSITDYLPAMISVMTPTGELESSNQRVLAYFGMSFEELRSWDRNEAVHPDDRASVLAAWLHAVQTEEPYDSEQRLRRADGVYRWFQVRGQPLRSAGGRVARWCVMCTDIDAYKRAEQDRLRNEEALERARAELAHVSRVASLGVLTASIAHEVNQPLSGIIINATTCGLMLAANPPNIAGASETARRTIRDGNRALAVIAKLRALFRKKPVSCEPVSLNDAAQEVLVLLRSDLTRRRISIHAQLAEDLPYVRGDRVQLQQVILNLLLNGADATEAVHDRPRRLSIRTERDGPERVRLTVQDNGVGIDPCEAHRLFDAFYTTKTTGMGIGLSVSRSILEGHEGQIWAAPNPDGPGVAFTFSVPHVAASSSFAASCWVSESPPDTNV